MSIRNFKPVDLPDDRQPHDRMSVTFGRTYNTCRRAGYLYALHRDVASTHPMERGSALHRVLELATLAAVEQGEPLVPPEVVKAIVNEVLADPEYWCPVEEHDYLRESAYRWAEQTALEPAALVAVETLFVLDVDGMSVRAKIDRAEIVDEGRVCRITDYKSSRALPSFEDIGRRRPDGTIAAKDYQLVLYALSLAFGRPVRVERCEHCLGKDATCSGCGGRGTVEHVEPFGVADRADRFELAYQYPGIPEKTGGMAHRDVSLSRLDLQEYLESVRAQVAQVRHSAATGYWPATYGEDHCGECPAPAECPIPATLRRHAGTVNTDEEAVEAMEQLAVEKLQHAARWDEIKRHVKAGGHRLRYGRNMVVEVGYTEKTVIKDRDAMFDAMQRAVDFGEPFDRGEFVRRQNSTAIVNRRLSEEELAVEAESATDEGAAA